MFSFNHSVFLLLNNVYRQSDTAFGFTDDIARKRREPISEQATFSLAKGPYKESVNLAIKSFASGKSLIYSTRFAMLSTNKRCALGLSFFKSLKSSSNNSISSSSNPTNHSFAKYTARGKGRTLSKLPVSSINVGVN